ncbi:hypothetical protein CJF32_00011030 [Rutstroemia sp. NJR-2017a WRK4]|nr:hypothetical protein CJF32_00011030 [Rutstroemia sp. NJR-2017a WRK4]
MTSTYDFIVVGAGASGCVVASRLARTSSRPSVLLLEAGGSNDTLEHLPATERFNIAFSPESSLNWHYKTTKQQQLRGQEIDYSRGKGLGGSTAINFCAWIVGSCDDYDEWAREVQDSSFGWENVKRCLKRIENLHPEIPDPKLRKYVHADVDDHGNAGPVHLTYGDSWLPDLGSIFVAAEESGLKTNPDINSGDAIGMGMGSICLYKGQRLTSSSTYLAGSPNNLTVMPNASVSRIIMEGSTAIGVETIKGEKFLAAKEVIVSGGAINTPQILMLSGLGPEEELRKFQIPAVQNLPMVGRNLQDHCFSPIGIVMKEDETKSTNGGTQSPSPMGWFKLPSVLASPEYERLKSQKRDFLQRPTVPSYEIATHTPPSFLSHDVTPGTSFLGAIALVMNPQSTGTVELKSTNPETAPSIDPKFLSHDYDRRVIIDSIRETMRMLSAPVYAKRTIKMLGPENDSDEAIWVSRHAVYWCRLKYDHVTKHLFSSWHMSCTARMGTNPDTACVDSDFRVFGVNNLRVVDLSICPFVPNNHTQSTAYIVGEVAAEKIAKSYRLDESLQAHL